MRLKCVGGPSDGLVVDVISHFDSSRGDIPDLGYIRILDPRTHISVQSFNPLLPVVDQVVESTVYSVRSLRNRSEEFFYLAPPDLGDFEAVRFQFSKGDKTENDLTLEQQNKRLRDLLVREKAIQYSWQGQPFPWELARRCVEMMMDERITPHEELDQEKTCSS